MNKTYINIPYIKEKIHPKSSVKFWEHHFFIPTCNNMQKQVIIKQLQEPEVFIFEISVFWDIIRDRRKEVLAMYKLTNSSDIYILLQKVQNLWNATHILVKKKRSTYGKIFFYNVKVSLKQQEEHSEIWFSQKYIGFQKQIVGVLRKKKKPGWIKLQNIKKWSTSNKENFRFLK